MASPYTETVDLTTRGREQARRERAQEELTTDRKSLDPISADDLPDIAQQALRAIGWGDLMEVQRKAIPHLLAKRDLIVQSKTGSGKTGAFLLPLFELLDPSKNATQALILTPTRELARQVHEEFEKMKLGTAETNELEAALVYGGVGYGKQTKALKAGVDVVVGTPGRVLDHLEKGTFDPDGLEMFILDEADEMLSMGFFPDVERIKDHLPSKGKRRGYLFSATMPQAVRSLSNEVLKEPEFLSLSVENVSVDKIEHRYYLVGQMEKDRALLRLIEAENPKAALIFANTKRTVRYLNKFLQNQGYNADEISGDLSQSDREKAMDRIRSGDLRFLVATDVAARGIDISDLSHVFVYDVPQNHEFYVHRTGRTARAGKSGKALVLATYEDEFQLDRIGARYGIDIQKTELPALNVVTDEVKVRLRSALEERLRQADSLRRERIEGFEPFVEELCAEHPDLLAVLVDEAYREHG
jgi:ATP-dependent RNA helicase DeaD